MPRTTCIVPGCPSKTDTCQFLSLPCNENLRMIWMKYLVPIVPSLQSLRAKQLVRTRICRLHFEDQYITSNNKRLSYGVPTLFTKEEIESGIPTVPLGSKSKYVLTEHSYCETRPHWDHNYTKDIELADFLGDVVTGNALNGTNSHLQGDAVKLGESDVPAYSVAVPLDKLTDTGAEYDAFTEPEVEMGAEYEAFTEPKVDTGAVYEAFAESEVSRPPRVTHNRLRKFNEIQNFLDEFITDIQDDMQYQLLDDRPTGKLADELKSYNFSTNVLVTNRQLEPYDNMEQLFHPEKAYAAITFTLLKQQELLEESIRDFLSWAANAELDYKNLERKVSEIFENGEFIKVSLQILQIVCKYRLKNTQVRKEAIVNQVSDEEIKESLSKLEHSSRCLFDEEALSSIQIKPSSKKSKTKLKHDRAVQVNILPKKIDKTVQVRPKIVRKAGKSVQVNINELEGIATATKVKKKDTGSQTTEQDKLLVASTYFHDDPPLREEPVVATIEDSLLSHCQKIQYVVNIKRKPLRHDGAKRHKDADSRESNTQAGYEPVDYSRTQDDSNDYNSRETDAEEVRPKKKRSAPEPSMPVLWDACQNLLSLGGSNVNEPETVQVYSTLERDSLVPKSPRRHGRPNFGKKRRPKIPDTLKDQHSPMKSTDTSPMKGTTDKYQIPGKSSTALHVCDSPYLLGGCKHTYDPQAESVSPSTNRDQSIRHSGGKHRHDIPKQRGLYENVDNSVQEASLVVQTQSPASNAKSESSPVLFNLLSRWT